MALPAGDGGRSGDQSSIILDMAMGIALVHLGRGGARLHRGVRVVGSSPTLQRDSTGGGLVLALDAGAALIDLEMVLFHPFVVIHPAACANGCFVPYDLLNTPGGMTLDGQMNTAPARGFFPWMPSTGSPIRLDSRGQGNFRTAAFTSKMAETKSAAEIVDLSESPDGAAGTRICKRSGLQLTKDLVEMAPAAHYCLGGIGID